MHLSSIGWAVSCPSISHHAILTNEDHPTMEGFGCHAWRETSAGSKVVFPGLAFPRPGADIWALDGRRTKRGVACVAVSGQIAMFFRTIERFSNRGKWGACSRTD